MGRHFTSYGIAAFTLKNDIPYLLMVQRRNSIPYYHFVSGRVSEEDAKRYIELITDEEKEIIKNNTYDKLWSDLHLWSVSSKRSEFAGKKSKFERLCGLYQSSLETKTGTSLNWEFPKGRKKRGESEVACALREFTEETSIHHSKIKFIHNTPITYVYTGLDGNIYKNVFYIAYIDACIDIVYKNNDMLIRKRMVSCETSIANWLPIFYARLNTSKYNRRVISYMHHIHMNKYKQIYNK
jgi:8-oxo-dGTP pyrophosphatase MutT (NUDIX family)